MLWLTFNGQYAFDNLDSAEKIFLGGPTAVRAYPVAEANGDHGMVMSAELRHQLLDKFQATAFYDWGQVTVNKETWDGWNSSDTSIKNRYVLKGAGLGFRWNLFDGYELVGNVARRIGKNPGASEAGYDSDGTYREYRSWISLVKVF
jgi:hemolysin activation/secretion protein